MWQRLWLLLLMGCLALVPGQALPAGEKSPRPRIDAHGDPLPPGALARLGTVRFRHRGRVYELAFLPDGKRLFSCGWGGTFRVWNLATGKELRRVSGEGGFRVSPNGKLAGEVLEDNSVRLWDIATGKQVSRFAGHPRPQPKTDIDGTSFVFCQDGKTVISYHPRDRKRVAAVWDAATGKELRRVGPSGNETWFTDRAITVAPDGTTLATREREGARVLLWDTATGKKRAALRGWAPEMLSDVVFAPDGQTMAAVNPSGGTVELWRARTGKRLRRLAVDVRLSYALPAFSPDGRLLVCAGEFGGLFIWDVAAGTHREVACPEVRGLTFSPNGKTLATSHADGTLGLWETATGKPIFRIPLRVNIDLTRENLRAALHSAAERISQRVYLGHSGMVMAFSPDGRSLAVGYEKRIYLLNAVTGEGLHPPEGHGEDPRQIAFSLDGKRAVAVAEDRTVCVWETSTGRELRRFTLPGKEDELLSRYRRAAVAFSDGRPVVALADGEKKQVRVWAVASGKLLHRLAGPGGEIRGCTFAPDGRRLAVAGKDSRILVVDVRSGKALGRLTWPPSPLDGNAGHGAAAIVFSPSGKTLGAVGYLPRSGGRQSPGQMGVRLWEVATAQQRRVFPIRAAVPPAKPEKVPAWGPTPPKRETTRDWLPAALAFFPDGRSVAVGAGGNIRLWGFPEGKELRRFAGPMHALRSVCFSPDGKLLAGHTVAGPAWLWVVATGKALCRLPREKDDSGAALAFTPDGKGLACGERDGTVTVWDVAWLWKQAWKAGPSPPAAALEKLWTDLASADAAKGRDAIALLSRQPAEAVALLKSRLRPFPPVPAGRVERLVTDLNSARFAVRERATRELTKLGDVAWPKVRKLLQSQPPLEVQRRAERILEQLEAPLSGELVRPLRALEALEQIGTADARQLLRALADGAEGHRLTAEARAALRRLARRTR